MALSISVMLCPFHFACLSHTKKISMSCANVESVVMFCVAQFLRICVPFSFLLSTDGFHFAFL